MLDDLDSTLEQLLTHELSGLNQSTETTVAISFDMPIEGSIKQKPAINLFLYDVRENLELRSSEWSVQRLQNGTAVKKRPPARIDCSYLITAWANSDDPQQEHHLLGEVMKLLLRYQTLPEAILQGSLKGQEPPPIGIGLRSSYLQSLGEFWQAIGGKPKAALNYTVTISVCVEEAATEFPLVLETRNELRRGL
jgi:Pvc16 N-terminal domain